MRGYPQLTLAMLRSQLREPVGFFFLLVFSPGLLLILGLMFGNDPQPDFGMRGFVDTMLPGLTVIAIVIVGVVLVPQTQLILRSTGALTRLRATPLRARTFVAADLSVNVVLGMVGALLTLLLGVLGFGVAWPAHPGRLVLALVLGLVALLALGYTLAALYPSVAAATGVGNALMILLMMTSGAFIPAAVLPEGVQSFMRFSPVHHFAELVRASWAGQPWPGLSVLVLVAMAVVLGTLGTALFRWDQVR